MNEKRKLFVFNVSGPYAVGKDTTLRELKSIYGTHVYRVRTLTTRPVSPEADPTYEQVSPQELQRRLSSGRWMLNYQLSGLTAYATSIDEIEEVGEAGFICILSVYAGPDGAGKLREVFGLRVLSIGLLPAPGSVAQQLEVLRARLLGRSRDDPAAIEARLQHQEEPLRYVLDNPVITTEDGLRRVFDHVLVNEDLDVTVRRTVQLFDRAFFEGATDERTI